MEAERNGVGGWRSLCSQRSCKEKGGAAPAPASKKWELGGRKLSTKHLLCHSTLLLCNTPARLGRRQIFIKLSSLEEFLLPQDESAANALPTPRSARFSLFLFLLRGKGGTKEEKLKNRMQTLWMLNRFLNLGTSCATLFYVTYKVRIKIYDPWNSCTNVELPLSTCNVRGGSLPWVGEECPAVTTTVLTPGAHENSKLWTRLKIENTIPTPRVCKTSEKLVLKNYWILKKRKSPQQNGNL